MVGSTLKTLKVKAGDSPSLHRENWALRNAGGAYSRVKESHQTKQVEASRVVEETVLADEPESCGETWNDDLAEEFRCVLFYLHGKSSILSCFDIKSHCYQYRYMNNLTRHYKELGQTCGLYPAFSPLENSCVLQTWETSGSHMAT